MNTESSTDIFEKPPNIKFHENLSNRSRAVPHKTDGQMGAQTVMMKLTVTSHNLVNVPKKTFTTADKQYFFCFQPH